MSAIETLQLEKWLDEDFSKDAPTLVQLCVNQVGFPVGFHHPQIFLELLGGSLPLETLEELRQPYVYLTAYYFCLDSVVDGHAAEKAHPLYLTHLLAAATYRLTRFFEARFPCQAQEFKSIFFRRISDNSKAVLSELIFRSQPTTPNELEEFDSIVGRSNSCLLLVDILSLATGLVIPKSVRKLVDDFLFYMQLGDDLGDWRIDYRDGRWTSFLRTCFAHLGRIAASEDELEHLVYLSGFYEHRALKILRGFDGIIATLVGDLSDRSKFRNFVQAQRIRLHDVLVGFVAEKRAHASG